MRALLSALLCAVSLPASALADTLVDNVSGVTLDDKGAVVRFNAIVFDHDGAPDAAAASCAAWP